MLSLHISYNSMSQFCVLRCVLSPLLYTFFTHDCQPTRAANTIIKFADNTMVIGLIANNDDTSDRDEVQNLPAWRTTNNLILNISLPEGTQESQTTTEDARKLLLGCGEESHVIL